MPVFFLKYCFLRLFPRKKLLYDSFFFFSIGQVQQIVDGAPSLKRISFVAHSLGGLFARYAIAMLYTPQVGYNEDVILLEELESQGGSHEFPGFQRSHEEAKVAGLEAVNFITLASPHLGVRGKKQVH